MMRLLYSLLPSSKHQDQAFQASTSEGYLRLPGANMESSPTSSRRGARDAYRYNRGGHSETEPVQFDGAEDPQPAPVRKTVCTVTKNEYGGRTHTTTISEWDGPELKPVRIVVVKMDGKGVVMEREEKEPE